MEFKTEKWSQIKELFEAALDVEPSSRRAFLEKESGSVELRNAVEELLNANEDASSFLQSRDAFAEDSPVDFAPHRLEPGTLLVDRFQMRRFISRGGGQAVLQGSIASNVKGYIVTLRAVQCHSGELIAEKQIPVEFRDSVLGALDQNADDLRPSLGESAASIRKYNVALGEATTSSIEALVAFSQGNLV
jgi:hypothetical protein